MTFFTGNARWIKVTFLLKLALILSFLFAPLSANAYIGPGAGLSAVGSVIALAAVVILLAVGFLWYPIKHMTNRRESETEEESSVSEVDGDSSDNSSGLL